MSALVPAVISAVLVTWLLWDALAQPWADLVEAVTWRWRRRGRHTVAAVRARQVSQERGDVDALDRVWVGAIADWAARARGQGLARSRIAAVARAS